MGETKQRRVVLKIIRAADSHMTAEEAHKQAAIELPGISLWTVYRNLNTLADAGEIRRIHGIDDALRYDRNISPHQHAVCTKCGRVADINELPAKQINDLSSEHGKAETYTLIIYMVCNACGGRSVSPPSLQ